MERKNGQERKPDGRKISKKLTPKQRRLVAKYANPNSDTYGNGTKSAIAAGYSERSAGQIGHEILKKPEIQREIERVLYESGATRELIGQVLKEGMNAHITRVFSPKDGELVYSKPLVDHPTRIKAAEVTGRLLGDFPTTHSIERRELLTIQQNIHISPPLPAKPATLEIEGELES